MARQLKVGLGKAKPNLVSEQPYEVTSADPRSQIARMRASGATIFVLAQNNVLVNCVTPAAVETEMFKQMTEEHIKYMLAKIPMGRFGKIEEIAAIIAWLASEDCSFTTGAVFDISGGRATY